MLTDETTKINIFLNGNKFLLWSPSRKGWYEVLGMGVRGG